MRTRRVLMCLGITLLMALPTIAVQPDDDGHDKRPGCSRLLP